ncbi:coiled-coil domain-containing protein 137 [Pyxicephalus adspersus]|uniref:coiled-coil domain-containing protein 137 n=1 Tax=Pyxicephalus adspersus TaxID=30357 RepID=UPI003B5C503F
MGNRPGNKDVGSAGRASVGRWQSRGNAKRKTNSTPKDLDTQEIPFKLREIMKSRMEMNKPKKRKKKKQGLLDLMSSVIIVKWKECHGTGIFRGGWLSPFVLTSGFPFDSDNILFSTDKVMFGEVAMEPPSLTVKPRKGAAVTKPGAKQLFLKKLLDKSSSPANPPAISMARKRMVEEERERVINAYREMKKRKLQQAVDSKPLRRQHT